MQDFHQLSTQKMCKEGIEKKNDRQEGGIREHRGLDISVVPALYLSVLPPDSYSTYHLLSYSLHALHLVAFQ